MDDAYTQNILDGGQHIQCDFTDDRQGFIKFRMNL